MTHAACTPALAAAACSELHRAQPKPRRLRGSILLVEGLPFYYPPMANCTVEAALAVHSRTEYTGVGQPGLSQADTRVCPHPQFGVLTPSVPPEIGG